ncbi:MAG: NAD(P)/FAD-dependent oxidoreductase [Candidatus Dormibacteraeota bacterium]|nr:NAD(P)/FAD-dependent oxidoreductase [Candidatus Dormibacteraeota bacterium]
MTEPTASRRPQVLIVGAGFGGLACARALDGTEVDVVLLDRHNYHLFTPLLYQVATGLLNPSEIAYPLRRIFRGSRNVRVRQATVRETDVASRVVRTIEGDAIPYDFLVLASGSVDNFFGNERLAEVSLGLKSLEDATRLRNQVLTCLERADSEPDGAQRQALLTFVVAGGGPTGVESSGALGELIQIVAGKDYHHIRREDVRIILLEAQDQLLSAFSRRIGDYAERVLRRRGIEVRTRMLVTAADESSVTLSDGSVLPTRTIVWSAGVRPNDPTRAPSLAHHKNGRIEVDACLRIAGQPRSFALGDVASPGGPAPLLPMLSPPAMQGGRYVARAILEEVRTGLAPQRPFHYVDKGTMATIGRRAGAARLPNGLEITGFFGWVTWMVVHVYYLVGFRNRARAIASWAWDYFRFDRPIRIILETRPAERPPVSSPTRPAP